MSSKLNYLISVSLKRKIKTKWFLIVNIILLIAISCVLNIDSIIKAFGGDFDKKQNIYIIDNVEGVYDIFSQQMDLVATNLEKENTYVVKKIDKSEKEAEELVQEDKNNIVIIFNRDDENVMKVKLITESFMDTIDYQMYYQAISNTKVNLGIIKSGIPMETISKIYKDVEVERIILDETKKSEEENMSMIMTTVFPIVILPFFMLTIFLVQMIGAEVNDEKSTRGMEIIISNVSPKTHFFSKVIAGNIFVILQGLLLFIYAAIGFFIRNKIGGSNLTSGLGFEIGKIINDILNSSIGSKLIYIIPLTIILMLFTFVAYSLLAGVLASMTTNTEDFQQIQTPIMLVSLLGYYLAIMSGVFNGALFIRILSYVPLISAILSPSLLVLGQIGVVDVIVSIIIVIITNVLFVKYGLRIYKVGILNYSAKGLWKKMFKAMKK